MIIPIFISHLGCPHECVFCNQRKITSRERPLTIDEAKVTIENYLSGASRETFKELAFYGGSFTAIPVEEQIKYLKLAKEYKDKGLVDGIHLSTRPDAIDEEILENLRKYDVDVIELGVQSFDDDVLKASARGHTAKDAVVASKLIKEYGFTLGIQLMVGLPKDTLEKSIYSAMEAVKLKPQLARIYPTIVIEDTALNEMYKSGMYEPLSLEDAIVRSCEIYKILYKADVTIMRVGLKASSSINRGGSIEGGTFHPAFRQLVEGRLMRKMAERLILKYENEKIEMDNIKANENLILQNYKASLYANPAWFSNLVGNSKENKVYLTSRFPWLNLRFKIDQNLQDGEILFKTENYQATMNLLTLQ